MGESLNRLEEVTLRLAAIRDELLALPEGPSPERFKLLTEQDALRAEASAFAEDADSHRSTEELKAALDSLTQRRRAILESRSGYVTSRGGAPTAGAWVGAEGRAQSAAHIERLNVRISEIEDELRDRAMSGE